MPYINPIRRGEVSCDSNIERPNNPGELNFCLTTIILDYLQQISVLNNPHYKDYNDVMGVLSCIQHELYRRMIAPYEDIKCKENGDVYDQPLCED